MSAQNDDYLDGDAQLGVVLEDDVYQVGIEYPSGDCAVMPPEAARAFARGILRCADEAEKLERQRRRGGS